MKRLFLVFALFLTSMAHAAPRLAANFDLQGVTVGQAVQLIYAEVLQGSYVMDADVVADNRLVTFRYELSRGNPRGFVREFLDALGYVVITRNGVDFLKKKPASETKEAEAGEIFIYRPKYRDASYLSGLLGPLVTGAFTVQRAVPAVQGVDVSQSSPQGSATATIDQRADCLVFKGPSKDVALLKSLLHQVDISAGEVVVRGKVYEYSTTERDSSAVNVAASLVRDTMTLNYGTPAVLDNMLKINTGSLDAVVSALASDSRFKVLSSPSLRIRSGASGRFSVGQEVPVLGALTFPQGAAQPVQSVEYRSSGVIFEVTPQVRESVVDLSVAQQLSNFVRTETGVNQSPTLIKREVKTDLSLKTADVVVLGGLVESKDSQSSSGLPFLPKALRSRGSDTLSTEILLVFQVERI